MYQAPKFESLLQGLAEPTVILTPDLVVRHANSAFLAATSTSQFDLLDRRT